MKTRVVGSVLFLLMSSTGMASQICVDAFGLNSLPITQLSPEQRSDLLADAVYKVIDNPSSSTWEFKTVDAFQKSLGQAINEISEFLKDPENTTVLRMNEKQSKQLEKLVPKFTQNLDALAQLTTSDNTMWGKLKRKLSIGHKARVEKLSATVKANLAEADTAKFALSREVEELTRTLEQIDQKVSALREELAFIQQAETKLTQMFSVTPPEFRARLETALLPRLESSKTDIVMLQNIAVMVQTSISGRIKLDQTRIDSLRRLGRVAIPALSANKGDVDLRFANDEEGGTRPPLSELFAAADATQSHRAHNEILIKYVERYAHQLSVEEILEITEKSTHTDAHNEMLKQFISVHSHDLSIDDAGRVASAATGRVPEDTEKMRNEILLSFAKQNLTRFTVSDVLALVKSTTFKATHNEILLSYVKASRPRLTNREITEISGAAVSPDVADQIARLIKM